MEQFSTPEKIAGFLSDCFIDGNEVMEKVEAIVNIEISEVFSCLKEIDVNNCNLTITKALAK